MPTVTMQHYPDEPDSLTSVYYDDQHETAGAGRNMELKFTVASHYDILVRLHFSSGGFSDRGLRFYFTVDSSGDGGTETSLAFTRAEAIESAVRTYGAPHCDAFRQLVDRLLVSQEEIAQLLRY